MNLAAKVSDDAFIRLGIAPLILVMGLFVLSNFKGMINYAYYRSQGKPATPFWVTLFRIGGSLWVILALSLIIGIW